MDYTPAQLREFARIKENERVHDEWNEIQKGMCFAARTKGVTSVIVGHIYPENIEKLRAAGFAVRSYPGCVENCSTYTIDWSEDNG